MPAVNSESPKNANEDDLQWSKRFSCWLALVRTNYVVLFAFVLVMYWPRLVLSYVVFGVAQLLRFFARLIGVECGRQVANRRILLITDYLPPQTHGIAIRCQAYAKELRAQGHYVVVFATAYDAKKETCFDHPNIPSVPNPFNVKNRIGYTAGVKLAWYLGAYSWDCVHLVYPSLIEMDIFSKHAPYPLDKIGLVLYDLVTKLPAVHWGTLNAAPTLCFAKAHCGLQHEDRLRCVPSGTHDVFTSKPEDADERARVRRELFGVSNESTKVILMVQRLSQEKGTERIFPCLASHGSNKDGEGAGVKGLLAIAGDGPSRASLEKEARERQLNVIFLGNVPHHDLPRLYRAADCFVTMSLSETYGLTCLEAQMCGCPAVMPYCDVFNEIWGHRVPESWRYNIDSTSELARAIAAAQTGRKFLEDHPVDQTWKTASSQLLEQYEECIEFNKVAKLKKAKAVDMLSSWIRVGVFMTVAFFISAKYFHALKRTGMVLDSVF